MTTIADLKEEDLDTLSIKILNRILKITKQNEVLLCRRCEKVSKGNEEMINKIVWFGIVLSCGGTIYETIKKEYPKEYNCYLNERASWKWYKRMWYLK